MRSLLLVLVPLGCIRPGVPGSTHRGPLPGADEGLIASAARIAETVEVLAEGLGPRNYTSDPASLDEAARYITERWRQQGYTVERQPVLGAGAWQTANLWVRVPGEEPPLVVGAHYDTAVGTPGADDNASGVAALLELSRALRPPVPNAGRAVVFIAWTNEEPPFFGTDAMGSAVHAQHHEAHGVIAIESIGLYSAEPGTQAFPFPLSLAYPSRGDFVAFVGNPGSHGFVRQVARVFREAEPFPSRGGSAPAWITGIGWSDHRSYWAQGVPALMVTDTAVFRNPHYHRSSDTSDAIDPLAVARVARGLAAVVADQRARSDWTGPAFEPPELHRVAPQQLDTLRGGHLVLEGRGLDGQVRVRLGGQAVPVVERVGGHTLKLYVESMDPGLQDLEIEGPAGALSLPGAVLGTTGSGPVRATCSTEVVFERDSAEVTVTTARALERERFCFTALAGTIEVVGHTDPAGPAGYNAELGLERARAVVDQLVVLGIDRQRFVVRSMGEASGEGRSPEGRRRVEVSLR